MHDLLQLNADDLAFFRIGLLINEPAILDTVAGAEEEQTFTWQTVAARAARLLIVTLDILGQIVVDDEAHVRLVDPHAEGNGRADHTDLVAQKVLLITRALLAVQARVIRRRADSIRRELAREVLRRLPRLAIDDPALPPARADEVERLFVGTGLGGNAVSQVGPVETGDVARGLAQVQLLYDVAAHALGGRGRERHRRHVRKRSPQRRQLPVFRPEIVSPLADAMRFVNGEQVYVPALQVFDNTGQHQSLRRNVKQTKLALVQPAQARA